MPATYNAIATTTLGSSQATITFSGISASFTDLRLVVNCLIAATGNPLYCRFNSDSSTSYSWTHLFGNRTSAISNRSTGANNLYLGETASNTSYPTFHSLDIMSYTASAWKPSLLNCARDMSGSGLSQTAVGVWTNTSAINSITIGTFAAANLAAGTTATLYGILRA